MIWFLLILFAQFVILCYVTFRFLNHQLQRDILVIQEDVITEISSGVEEIFEWEVVYTESELFDTTSAQDSNESSSMDGYDGDISHETDL